MSPERTLISTSAVPHRWNGGKVCRRGNQSLSTYHTFPAFREKSSVVYCTKFLIWRQLTAYRVPLWSQESVETELFMPGPFCQEVCLSHFYLPSLVCLFVSLHPHPPTSLLGDYSRNLHPSITVYAVTHSFTYLCTVDRLFSFSLMNASFTYVTQPII